MLLLLLLLLLFSIELLLVADADAAASMDGLLLELVLLHSLVFIGPLATIFLFSLTMK